jgi:hypothetical protein
MKALRSSNLRHLLHFFAPDPKRRERGGRQVRGPPSFRREREIRAQPLSLQTHCSLQLVVGDLQGLGDERARARFSLVGAAVFGLQQGDRLMNLGDRHFHGAHGFLLGLRMAHSGRRPCNRHGQRAQSGGQLRRQFLQGCSVIVERVGNAVRRIEIALADRFLDLIGDHGDRGTDGRRVDALFS